jgi:hypothetical protein
MADLTKPAAKKPAWVATFATRLCVIAWTMAVFTEILPPSGIESLCILFGSQAAALGVLTCLIVWIRFRPPVLFLLLIATAAPATYFVLVLQKMAHDRGWFGLAIAGL